MTTYSPIDTDALVLKMIIGMETKQIGEWWSDSETQRITHSMFALDSMIDRDGGWRNQFHRHWPESAVYKKERPHGKPRVPLFERHPTAKRPSLWRLRSDYMDHLPSNYRSRIGSKISSAPQRNLESEIARIDAGISSRVRNSGNESKRLNPLRSRSPDLDLLQIWNKQNGACALCGGQISLDSSNSMLRMSPDRIDSSNSAYDQNNVHITHQACNLAKNDHTLEEYQEWLDIVRNGIENAINR